jgi:hypothetical protein
MSVKVCCQNGCKILIESKEDLHDSIYGDHCCECGASISEIEPKELSVYCPCGYSNVYDLDSLKHYLNEGCPEANPDTENSVAINHHHLTFQGSYYQKVADFEWGGKEISTDYLTRELRDDFWEYLTHYTSREGFESILRNQKIEIFATGYFGKKEPGISKAVCLTETPPEWSDEFFDEYGEYAFVFHKSDLQKIGALPVYYMDDSMLNVMTTTNSFPDKIKPFIQLLRTPSTGGSKKSKYDWIHNREWRVPQNIDITAIKPSGVFFKTPYSRGHGSDDDELKIAALMNFGLIKFNK